MGIPCVASNFPSPFFLSRFSYFSLSRLQISFFPSSLSLSKMVEAAGAMCFSNFFSSSVSSISCSKKFGAFSLNSSPRLSSVTRPQSSRHLRLIARASSNSGNFFSDEFFPWSDGDTGTFSVLLLQWLISFEVIIN